MKLRYWLCQLTQDRALGFALPPFNLALTVVCRSPALHPLRLTSRSSIGVAAAGASFP